MDGCFEGRAISNFLAKVFNIRDEAQGNGSVVSSQVTDSRPTVRERRGGTHVILVSVNKSRPPIMHE